MRVGNLIRWNGTRWNGAAADRPDPRTGAEPCLIVAIKNHDWGVNSGNRFHLLVGGKIVLLLENYVRQNYEVIS